MSNNIITKPGTIPSHIVNEEYFPLRVVYDPSIESIRFVGFYYKDTDLLEFTVDRKTGAVKEMQIVVCSHFQFVNNIFPPEYASESVIHLDYAQHNDCDVFNVTVFRNAVQIIVSSQTVAGISKCGQVTYGISATGELVSVLVSNMSTEDITHTKAELSI
jgi:hypothetical protein